MYKNDKEIFFLTYVNELKNYMLVEKTRGEVQNDRTFTDIFIEFYNQI